MRRVIVCGDDPTLAERSDCPSVLHDWPLRLTYLEAGADAASRLSRGWSNTRCPECGRYGWRPGRMRDEVRVTHNQP